MSPARQPESFIGKWLVGFTCGLTLLAGANLSGQHQSATRRWAIVALDEKSKELADLLTVEASSWPNVELLEREQIDRVLAEMQLNSSGLVNRNETIQFGQLAKADALILVNWDTPTAPAETSIETEGSPASTSPSSLLRLRLVETTSSVRMLDVVLPSTDVTTSLRKISGELQAAVNKIAVSPSNRQLIGVMLIKSEEPGDYLASYCKTLTRLVEAELYRQPQLLVLERSQLQELTKESALTGVELKLRGATRLLDVGLRRSDSGQGLIATCRLIVPGEQAEPSFRVDITSQNTVEVRNEIVSAVMHKLGQAKRQQPVTPENEASEFDQKRAFFERAFRYEETADLAEAAMALAPTPERLSQTLIAYKNWVHAKSYIATQEAFQAALSYRQFRLNWLKQTQPLDAMRQRLDGSAFEPNVLYIKTQIESDEVRRLRSSADELSLKILELQIAEATTAHQRLQLLFQSLLQSPLYCESGQDFVRELPRLLARIDQEIQFAQVKREPSDPIYVRYISLLAHVIDLAVAQTNLDPNTHSNTLQTWKPNSIDTLADLLTTQSDTARQVARLVAQMGHDGEVGETAAKELWNMLKGWPPVHDVENNIRYRELKDLPIKRLATTSWGTEFAENLLIRAEQKQDATEIREQRLVISASPTRVGENRSARLERALAVVSRFDQTKDRMNEIAYWQNAVEKWQRIESRQRGPSLPVMPSQISSPESTKLWKRFSIKPLYVTRTNPNVSPSESDIFTDPEQMYCGVAQVFVDRRQDAIQRGGELIFLWERPNSKKGLQRFDLTTQSTRRIGVDFPGISPNMRPLNFSKPTLTVSPDAIYVAAGAPGFYKLQRDTVTSFTEEEGAPSNLVHQLAWFKDLLYVAFDDAFASFNPVTREFQVLATSKSVESRNPLDGRGSFAFQELIADEEHDCLWISVQDNTSPQERSGWWQFKPVANEFNLVKHNRSRQPITSSWTPEGLLLQLPQDTPGATAHTAWAKLDPTQASLSCLEGYSSGYGTRFVMLGDMIFAGGRLLTPDGQSHLPNLTEHPFSAFKSSILEGPFTRTYSAADWSMLARVGNGFITHYEHERKILWYIEPN
jgi:hypothetical protein